VPTDSNWLWNLLLPFHETNVAVTYGRQVGGLGSKFSEKCHFEKYFPRTGDGSHQVDFFCNNANSAFRRSGWQVHRFDEEVTGLEDMQLAQILVNAGGEVSYVPSAAVVHHHHEIWRQVLRRYEREAIALRGIMPEIHVHWHDALRYFLARMMGDGSRAISQRKFFSLFAEIFSFRFCQYYGAWKGNHQHRKLSKRGKEKYFYPN
jgi:cellulose synthase/poly-beta-1,6-N-acetylglucosamine synthase-like glycosyltransferase